ncbi:MAG: arginine repressor [Clostridia bacterium]|nr:arginine repressor [Clostridia bacterium]
MKQKRHAAILNLIANHEITTQEELATRLCEMGFRVTQATVSRDIKELRLTKIPLSGGLYKYTQPAVNDSAWGQQMLILSKAVCSVCHAQNIVVIKTQAGMAQAAAAVLDSLLIEEIVGSLAGDDTIFCVTQDNDSAIRLTQQVKSFL